MNLEKISVLVNTGGDIYANAGDPTFYALATKSKSTRDGFSNCKAYIQDDVHADFSGYANYDVNRDNFTIFIAIHADNVESEIPKILQILHSAEEMMGFEKTDIKVVEKSLQKARRIFLLTADKQWQIALPMISMYTLLTRIAKHCQEGEDCITFLNRFVQVKNDNYSAVDYRYACSGLPVMKNILKFGPYLYFSEDIKENYLPNSSGSHDAGIAAMGSVATTIDRYNHNFRGNKVKAKIAKLKEEGHEVF